MHVLSSLANESAAYPIKHPLAPGLVKRFALFCPLHDPGSPERCRQIVIVDRCTHIENQKAYFNSSKILQDNAHCDLFRPVREKLMPAGSGELQDSDKLFGTELSLVSSYSSKSRAQPSCRSPSLTLIVSLKQLYSEPGTEHMSVVEGSTEQRPRQRHLFKMGVKSFNAVPFGAVKASDTQTKHPQEWPLVLLSAIHSFQSGVI
eukprot:891183-Pleurochrysis_carterae.AAC.2